MQKRIPLNKALIWIFLSTLLISGSATLGWLYTLHVQKVWASDDDYLLNSIVDQSVEREKLTTEFLLETLGVDLDNSQNLYDMNLGDLKSRLERTPVIHNASVTRLPPNAIAVDYTLRHPIAYVGDFKNIGVDQEGYLFPFSPFFTPKNLPVIFLGSDGVERDHWRVEKERYRLAIKVVDLMHSLQQSTGWNVVKVDLSNACLKSYGRREIVVELEERALGRGACLFTIRLNVDCFEQNLANYLVLREQFSSLDIESHTIIDMRIAQLAFLSSCPNLEKGKDLDKKH